MDCLHAVRVVFSQGSKLLGSKLLGSLHFNPVYVKGYKGLSMISQDGKAFSVVFSVVGRLAQSVQPLKRSPRSCLLLGRLALPRRAELSERPA